MFYKRILILDQVFKLLTKCILYVWIGLSILFCEPLTAPNDICHFTFTRILMTMMLIGWLASAYAFCGHPTLTSLLFLFGGLFSLVNILSINLVIRVSIPSFFSSIGYGNMLVADFDHMEGLLHASHFSGHVVLFIVAVYVFLALDPSLKFVKCNHQRISIVEAGGHVLMSILEPVYLVLVIQNLIEYFEHK